MPIVSAAMVEDQSRDGEGCEGENVRDCRKASVDEFYEKERGVRIVRNSIHSKAVKRCRPRAVCA